MAPSDARPPPPLPLKPAWRPGDDKGTMPAFPRLLGSTLAVLAVTAVPATADAHDAATTKHAAGHTARALPATFKHRYRVTSAKGDGDHDGLTNLTEYLAHTSPRRADSDRDGVRDDAEDRDHDGLDNLTEQRAGTDAGRADSDHDGRPDGREDSDGDGLRNRDEQRTANDPGDPDSDDDGIRDGAEGAGRVLSFNPDTGVLQLRLAATGKVRTGTVDEGTELSCGSSDDLEATNDDTGADEGDDPSADDDATDAGDDDGAADDRSDDDGDDPAGDDAGDDDPLDDTTGDRVVLRAPVLGALAHAAQSTDDEADDPAGDDASDDDTEADACGADADVAPGTWVHASEVGAGDDGAGDVFDTLVLVQG